MAASVGGEILTGSVAHLMAYTIEAVQEVGQGISGVIRTFTTVYVALVGLSVMRGYVKNWQSWLFSAVLVGALEAVIVESRVYGEWVVNPIYDASIGLAGLFVQSYAGDVFGLFGELDDLTGRLLTVSVRIEPKGSDWNLWASMRTGIASALLYILFGLNYLAFLAGLITSFAFMFLLFAFGPIPIFLASFTETRFVFWAWLRGVLQYALTPAFMSAVMGLVAWGVSDAVDDLEKIDFSVSGVFNGKYATTLIWCGLGLVFLKTAPGLAALITGGSPGSEGGMMGAGMRGVAGSMGSVKDGLITKYNSSDFVKEDGGMAGLAKGGLSAAYNALKGLRQ